eukprot:3972661-Alexandrium_andersonii.AAC.1
MTLWGFWPWGRVGLFGRRGAGRAATGAGLGSRRLGQVPGTSSGKQGLEYYQPSRCMNETSTSTGNLSTTEPISALSARAQ